MLSLKNNPPGDGAGGLGWTASYLSEALEFDLDNSSLGMDVERFQHGLVGLIEIGVLFHLDSALDLRAGWGGRFSSPALNGEDGNPTFDRQRMVFSLGLEWAP